MAGEISSVIEKCHKDHPQPLF